MTKTTSKGKTSGENKYINKYFLFVNKPVVELEVDFPSYLGLEVAPLLPLLVVEQQLGLPDHPADVVVLSPPAGVVHQEAAALALLRLGSEKLHLKLEVPKEVQQQDL